MLPRGKVDEQVEDEHLKAMLFDAIETMDELQVLTWLEERAAGASADAAAVATAKKLSVQAAQKALDALCARGFLLASTATPKRFLYSTDPVVRDALDQITDAYRADPSFITRLVTENAHERLSR